MIYLALPYSSTVMALKEERYKNAMKCMACLLGKGEIVFCPIVMCHPIAVAYELPGTADFWRSFNKAFFSNCEVLGVLMLDGWRESIGVQEEIGWAKHLRMPILYYRYEDYCL